MFYFVWKMCRRTLGLIPGRLRLQHCQSEALNTRLDFIHFGRMRSLIVYGMKSVSDVTNVEKIFVSEFKYFQ
jgi:hypothetical protein